MKTAEDAEDLGWINLKIISKGVIPKSRAFTSGSNNLTWTRMFELREIFRSA